MSDRPTSPRAILHHTDPNRPNILKGSVYFGIDKKKMNFHISKLLHLNVEQEQARACFFPQKAKNQSHTYLT